MRVGLAHHAGLIGRDSGAFEAGERLPVRNSLFLPLIFFFFTYTREDIVYG